MTLKESYRYANYLDRLLSTVNTTLGYKPFITNTVIEHYCSKAYDGATDFVEQVDKPVEYDYTANQLLDFAVRLIREREALSKAISEAKKTTEIDIDTSISMNKKKQDFIKTLVYMETLKNGESKSTGIAYKLDNDGKQTSYRYDTKQIITIDFNRDDVKGLIKKLKKENDLISDTIDKIEITTEVNHEPYWELTDTFDEAVLK